MSAISHITVGKEETLSFRLDPSLKAAFTRVAADANRPPAALLRDLVRAHVEQVEYAAFAMEAARQSRAIAAAGLIEGSDEAAAMAEIAVELDKPDPGWTA